MRRYRIQVPSSKFQTPKARLRAARSEGLAAETSVALELHESTDSAAAGKPYDLEERTALFGEAIIQFSRKISRGPGNDRLIGQLVGAATSVGANYAEASETVSRKDFKYAISRCVKEAKETLFFLRIIAAAEPDLADEARELYRECRELHLIFASMYRK